VVQRHDMSVYVVHSSEGVSYDLAPRAAGLHRLPRIVLQAPVLLPATIERRL
jgi:hypothetical protein